MSVGGQAGNIHTDLSVLTKGVCLGGQVSRQVPYMHDSSAEAARMFDILIHPVTTEKFFR